MGYRSQVAWIVETDNAQALINAFIKTHSPDDKTMTEYKFRKMLEGYGAEITETRVKFSADYVKWYSTKAFDGLFEGFPDVDAMEAFLEFAQYGEDCPKNRGAFVRIGEETEDLEERYWETWDRDGEGWELLSLQRTVEFTD